jgi:hypothetical protein
MNSAFLIGNLGIYELDSVSTYLQGGAGADLEGGTFAWLLNAITAGVIVLLRKLGKTKGPKFFLVAYGYQYWAHTRADKFVCKLEPGSTPVLLASIA